MIVTSATYRQASRPAAADDARWRQAVERDPHNRYWSRFPRRRLTGETVRDLLLSATGAVNLERHGEGVRPPLPPEVVQTLLQPAHWQVSEREADHYRRSIYVFARRNLRYPLFESFDRPAATTTCAARPRSTTALQSLLLFNGELSFEAARRLAGSALAAAPDDADEQIARCYWLALCREPSGEEFAEAAAFLAAQAAQLKAAGRTPDTLAAPLPAPPGGDPYHAAALVDFALALFNASEFVHLE